MNITLSVIKADIGGYVGHSDSHPDVIAKGEECMAKAKRNGTLVDYHVTKCGDDLQLIMTHQKGVDSEKIHKLAWDTFVDCTAIAKKLKLHGAGQDVLANAFMMVAGSSSKVNLLLLNEGSQGQVIRQILRSRDVSDRVTYAGQVSQRELPRYYQMADVYISPSHVDGSSVSLMEALACGLPCLVSDIPANLEWVTDGVNGWLFRDGDANALAAKILAILGTRESLEKIGQAARRVAEERADWKKNFHILLDTYELVLR